MIRIDQTALFESIMSGNYEYDEEYWEDISDDGKLLLFEDGLYIFANMCQPRT